MKLRAFTLHHSPEHGFDDRELQAFCQDHSATLVAEHFAVIGDAPVWGVLVSYKELLDRAPKRPAARRKDPRSDLNPEDLVVYEALRDWRNTRGKEKGAPPYVILTNNPLAEIARHRPRSLADLRTIRGVGDNKIEEWGEEILEVLKLATTRTEVTDA